MLTASALKSLLAARRLRLTKRLGQHHLIEPRLITRIVEACQLAPQDTVVEIGAGLGALTEPIAQRAGRVIAVEVDRNICALLQERLVGYPTVQAVCEDILRFTWDRYPNAVVIGAIPYQITSPLLVSLAELRQTIGRAVLVLQLEVARRLMARPGTKAYGRLSVLGQYCWDIREVCRVSRSAFFPQPAVDSSCLSFTPWPAPPVNVENESLFFQTVKAAFSQRRKTLVNCLSHRTAGLASRQALEGILRELRLPVSVRGEALSLEQAAALANALWRAQVR